MATTATTNYGFLKPTVGPGGDDDAWGGHLNTTIDDIDATIKTVSDVADDAASDAAAALAAVGGNATIPFAAASTTGNGGFSLALDTSSAFQQSTSTGGVCSITLISTMANSTAIRKTLVVINASGGSTFFSGGSGVNVLIADVGNGATTGITAQGRHIVEIYASQTSGGVCTVVLKRIGSATA